MVQWTISSDERPERKRRGAQRAYTGFNRIIFFFPYCILKQPV